VIQLKGISFLLVLGLAIMILAGCGKIETREKTLPDGRTVIIDSTGKIVPDGKLKPLEGYTYDEQAGRYINETTGVWYIVENGYRVIPPEEYFDPDKVGIPSAINISNRPDDVWELKEIRDITVKEGDTLSAIITQYSMNHFRMNRDWYSRQVIELNNITDPHFIRVGDTLKIPIYIDIGAKVNQG